MLRFLSDENFNGDVVRGLLQVIEELLLLDACTETAEWSLRVLYLPL